MVKVYSIIPVGLTFYEVFEPRDLCIQKALFWRHINVKTRGR